jgi:formyltetrahydrofolate deformylase
MSEAYILTLSCPDRPGIVHAVSGFLLERGGNIEEAAQYNDHDTGLFFMRVRFACGQLTQQDLRVQLKPVRRRLPDELEAARVHAADEDRHLRQQGRPLPERPAVPLEERAAAAGHPGDRLQPPRVLPAGGQLQHPVPPHPGDGGDQGAVRGAPVRGDRGPKARELVVLARYMQILSATTCARKLAGRAINIHHSFLPSFKGAKPYYQAHDRGVKLIGATAHYVTADLDEGPIIEQDVERADHTDTVEDLTARGRDTESQVLARAVKWHSEHRVLLNGHRTVVFK